ncbi:exonuclease V a 5' deoxyribonuclease-domain-containing protein [Xylariales sp. PMI_506]|nr:exonuclease V a 5' deoxyribonuclease-domain-containing protein [Xylariales sp. PMI_506]
MADSAVASERPSTAESDYGSDFSAEEESIVIRILERLQSPPGGQEDPTASLRSGLRAAGCVDSVPPDSTASDVLSALKPEGDRYGLAFPLVQAEMPGVFGDDLPGSVFPIISPDGTSPGSGYDYADLSNRLPIAETEALPTLAKEGASPSAEDERSPLERFRTFPKKPLTVTDLSSGAWCELQYWYTLTLLPGGRKTRTAAMQGGSKVHKVLEDEVHTTVEVTVSRKEEAFALKLWNLIQGLRTLRDEGLTRELEVWGVIEGQVVNGVIDQLSHSSPALESEQVGNSDSVGSEAIDPQSAQSSITDYFGTPRLPQRKVFLTDVKTRGSNSLPTGAALRPSKLQLSLYHKLLGEMAEGKLDFSVIAARYGLQEEVRFSDAFMAQIGSLHDEIFDSMDMDELPAASVVTDSTNSGNAGLKQLPDLMRYRSIEQLLPLVQSELRETFPQGADDLGNIMEIQYRHRDDGRIIGKHIFSTDAESLDKFLQHDLAWWLGKRRPEGVPIEEAYKCRWCEFAASCHWRKERDEEILRNSRRYASERTLSGFPNTDSCCS